MDYQEAILSLKFLKDELEEGNEYIFTTTDEPQAIDVAISAMNEIQEYHKTGLCPKQVTETICELGATKRVLKHYQQLGTLEEVREAVEKQKAISREIIEGKYFCPKCHNLMPYPGYCGCGQKLY